MIAVFCKEKRGNYLEVISRNAEDAHRGVCERGRTGGTDCLLHPVNYQTAAARELDVG